MHSAVHVTIFYEFEYGTETEFEISNLNVFHFL